MLAIMLIHPQFNPIALDLKVVQIHWYGLTYLVAFTLFYWLAGVRASRAPFAQVGWTRRDVEDILFYGVLGVVIGGRLGYVLFYKPGYYLANPLEVFAVWKGGMAFHGGLLGVIAALALFARMRGRSFLEVADLVAPCVPLGLASGRIGNFINGELWGRAADASLPWAMVFPQSGSDLPRHPSQLYQFALEGVLLFALLWWFASREGQRPLARGARPAWGRVSGAFLMGYGVLRFVVEFFREPDSFLGLLSLGLSMGQWLCVPMVALGAFLFWRACAGTRAAAA
jgi:phosphatidylglycerol:prolipoprotein diacylglycerol transferase